MNFFSQPGLIHGIDWLLSVVKGGRVHSIFQTIDCVL